jgi:CheY-like chemotaxis protein
MQGVKKILIVDDEPDTIAYLTAVLEDHAFTVLAAHSAERGMEILNRQGADLILVDLMMPGASGLSLIHRLRSNARYEGIPVILLTGKAEVLPDRGRTYLDRFHVRPPEGILEKPFDPDHLLNVVRRLAFAGASEPV